MAPAHAQAAQAGAEAEAGRSRRRVGWRKGSEVDEELWPTEAFGGVSDEQFWDDMASDKPLATTARTAAPPASGPRRRLPDVVPARDGDDRGRGPGDGNRPGPQPLQSGPQPIQGGTQPIQVAARSYQPGTSPQPYQAAAQPYQAAAQPYQPSYQPPTQPAPIAGQGGRGGPPVDPRGRGRMANGTDAGAGAAAGEDPLTSSAYSLRPPGAVDGRSYQSSRRSRDQYEAADAARYEGFRSDPLRSDPLRSDPLRADSPRSDPLRSDGYWSGGRADPLRGTAGTTDAYGSTAGHPYPERPYGDPAQPTASPPIPSYGETYGYGYPVSPVDDPRQPNGTRGQGRSGGGSGSWAARQPYPNGNGHVGSYDPRTNGRG